MDEEAVARAVAGLALKDGDGAEMSCASHRPLEPTRRQIMATAFPSVGDPENFPVAVVAKKDSSTKEFLALFRRDASGTMSAPELLAGSCQITYEDLTPAECIEYCFTEAPDSWAMAQLSQDALDTYRGMKFETWKGMLVNPTCEAQFRRMLHIGMISKLYDPQVFPTPEGMRSKYQVTDERTGKLIELPHPVQALRVWDPAAQGYQEIETRLAGAPSEAEAAQWWEGFVQELGAKHGAEYIAGLLAGK